MMRRMRPRWLVLLVVGFAALLAVVFAEAQRGRRSAPAPAPSVSSSSPQLWITHGEPAELQGEPAVRFAVYHAHGLAWCSGYLYFTRARVGYEVTNGPRDYSKDSFLHERAELLLEFLHDIYVKVRIKGGRKYDFQVVRDPMDPWGSSLENVSTRPVREAWENFDAALEHAQASLPKPAAPAAPREVPTEVLVLEPSGAGSATVETNSATLTVRGVAIDSKGVALVRVGNKLAALQPRSDMATEFWVEDYPLVPGDNEIEVVVTNSARAEAKTVVTVRRVEAAPPQPPAPAGLTLEQVVKLLEAGVTPARVETIVKERGAGFGLSEENEKKLREAGATDVLLLAIAKARK